MLQRAKALSSTQAAFLDECNYLKSMFLKLRYPSKLVNNIINSFISTNDNNGDENKEIPRRTLDEINHFKLPFKDQKSADSVKRQLRDLSNKLRLEIKPIFVSKKIEDTLKLKENKPPLVNDHCVVYLFQCDLCEANYVGFTARHLHQRISEHKYSAIGKHYFNNHGNINFLRSTNFKVLKKCTSRWDCLVNEMLFIKDIQPSLNTQSDSIRAKVFT